MEEVIRQCRKRRMFKKKYTYFSVSIFFTEIQGMLSYTKAQKNEEEKFNYNFVSGSF